MNEMKFIRLIDQLIILLLITVLALLPSIHTNNLMHGTVSGKMFFFLYALLIAVGLLTVKTVIKSPVSIRLSKIDGLLLIWIAFVLLNGLFQKMPVTVRLLEFLGLIVFFILIRQIKPSKYGLLLIAMMIGGVVQAVYGNLQLWGYYPSHHSMFRITGSFP